MFNDAVSILSLPVNFSSTWQLFALTFASVHKRETHRRTVRTISMEIMAPSRSMVANEQLAGGVG